MTLGKVVKKPKGQPVIIGPAVPLPGKHKGKIPVAVLRAAVNKVVGERKLREAAEDGGSQK